MRSRILLVSALFLFVGHGSVTTKAEEVYMIRGLMNAFSDGVDEMANTLKSRGIRTEVMSNGNWNTAASDIIKRSKSGKVSHPIIIVGFSWGGLEAVNFANRLGKNGVKTALLIGIDPGFAAPRPFTKGAQQVVNYKLTLGKNYRAGKGFDGKIKTIDATKYATGHTSINESKKLQSLVVGQIRRKAGK